MHSIRRIYRILALTMAFLIFFSSVGFSINMHYCQGKLKSFSLIGKAKNCHEMAKATKSCHHHQAMIVEQTEEGCSIDKKDCCENETLRFQLEQDQKAHSSEALSHQQVQQFLIAYLAVFFQDDFPEKDQVASECYRPPLIPRDIPVLFESFLL